MSKNAPWGRDSQSDETTGLQDARGWIMRVWLATAIVVAGAVMLIVGAASLAATQAAHTTNTTNTTNTTSAAIYHPPCTGLPFPC